MADILLSASREAQLALINAHPDLAGKAAIRGELTASSTSEQAGAGIHECSAEEFARFTELNDAYKARFGFIKAVKGSNRHQILAAFEERIQHSADEEFATALAEINKIALPACSSSEACGDEHERRTRALPPLPRPRRRTPGQPGGRRQRRMSAPASRMLQAGEPVEGRRVRRRGKWMDGWETRRKRFEGRPGGDPPGCRALKGVDIDTRFFTGNHPPAASWMAASAPKATRTTARPGAKCCRRWGCRAIAITTTR